MSREAQLRKALHHLLDAQYAAEEFIQSVTGWNGNPEDKHEVLDAIRKAIDEAPEVS